MVKNAVRRNGMVDMMILTFELKMPATSINPSKRPIHVIPV